MWPNLQETANLVTFTKEVLNGKLFGVYIDQETIGNLAFFCVS